MGYTSVYDTLKGFYKCTYKGQVGYIQKQYLSTSYQPKPKPKPQTSPDKYDLSLYEYKRVESKGRGSLVFQKAPKGSFMSNHKFYDGDWIYVNTLWRQQGYAMAYEDGEYGYVDASYIAW